MRRAACAWVAPVLALLLLAPAAGAAAPQLGPAWTSGVGTVSAGLRAEIDPGGLATAYRFSYLTEAAYRANLQAGNDGFAGAARVPASADAALGSAGAVTVAAQQIASLAPDTGYRYRVQASNAAGEVVGPARAFATEGFAGSSSLLDERGWELVSPLEKGAAHVGGPGETFGGGAIQAAAAGGAFTYSSTSSFGAAEGAPAASQYLAQRGGSGWVSANISGATVSGAYGEEPDGVPYQLFSPDLGRALVLDGRRCAPGDPCPRSYALRESAGGSLSHTPAAPDLHLAGVGAELGQVVLASCAALTADATEAPAPGGCDPGKPNLYLWSGAGLGLVNLLPASSQGTPGAELGAPAGAVSADGSRVYWRHGADLYLREGSLGTEQVDAAVGGGGTFETASATGAIAYFSKGGHLYRYEAAAGAVADLTPAGGLQGVLGASADGGRIYYLTVAGLFLRDGETTVEVATGADASNYPPATGTARLTADGSHLAFLSHASLTGYDNRDAVSGVPRSEVFLYDAAAGTLLCASCNPTGERPLGDSTIPGAVANGRGPWALRAYKPRALVADGRRLFFDSADALAIQDTGGRPDVYEWEAPGAGSCGRAGGCLALISRGRNSEGGSFLDASAAGGDVFFLTADSLVGADLGFADVYDAREGGGFAAAAKPIECVGDACQPLPSEPEDPQPGTLLPSSGNPPPRSASPPACRKGWVKKRGRCVRKPSRHRHRSARGRAGRGSR